MSFEFQESTQRAGLIFYLYARLIHWTTPPPCAWIEQALGLREHCSAARFRESFTTAGRFLGHAPIKATDAELQEMQEFGVDWPIGRTVDQWARIAVLLSATIHLSEEEAARLVRACYDQGDNGERQAVLRALPLLPKADRFVAIAMDGCRSHVQPIFEAIACENPYPAGEFPELNFNQMVLKALFTGVPLDRIVGLKARITPELQRMARDYECERRAAGRQIPPDLDRLSGGADPTLQMTTGSSAA
jgi:hypothetical protein